MKEVDRSNTTGILRRILTGVSAPTGAAVFTEGVNEQNHFLAAAGATLAVSVLNRLYKRDPDGFAYSATSALLAGVATNQGPHNPAFYWICGASAYMTVAGHISKTRN